MSRLNTGTDSSSGASQKPVVARIMNSVVSPARVRRPSNSQAISIRATPVHNTIDDSTSPCPKRSQDMCSDSSSGSCGLVLPAPSPPTVISTEPKKPSFAGRACGVAANAEISKKRCLTDFFA